MKKSKSPAQKAKSKPSEQQVPVPPNPMTEQWLKDNEYPDSDDKPTSPEEKQRDRGTKFYERMRRFARTQNENWLHFKHTTAFFQDAIIDYFTPESYPAVVAVGEGRAVVVGKDLWIPTPAGVVVHKITEYKKLPFDLYLLPGLNKHAYKKGFFEVVPSEVLQAPPVPKAGTQYLSWNAIKLFDIQYYKLPRPKAMHLDDGELTNDEARQVNRLLERGEADYKKFVVWLMDPEGVEVHPFATGGSGSAQQA